jgi:sigma-B regulation protein RsbU (phosphoserine phosphatase)
MFMKAELKKNIRNLMDITAAKERIEGELNVAREIQLGLLQKVFPPFPHHGQFDLFATLEPAKEVGGDLYDFFFIDDDHLCFALGDVSEKGVPAALFMTITMTLLKNTAKRDISPAEMMYQINNVLCAENPRSMFVTLFIGILNIRTGKIRYSNGGHNPPVLVSSNEGVVYKTDLSGPIVGPIEDMNYNELTIMLNPGDALFLYTDGVTEAMNPEDELFSEERLLTEMKGVGDKSVEEIVSTLMMKVKKHARSAPQSDDIAMLVLRFKGEH